MSGSEGGPDIETLQRAGREFARGNISQSELEQVESGERSLSEVRTDSGGGGGDADREREREREDEDTNTDTDTDTDTNTSGSNTSTSGTSNTNTNTNTNTGNTNTNTNTTESNTDSGSASGSDQQAGIDAPSIAELGELGQEFASGGDVSQEELSNADTRFQADVNNDGTVDDADAEELADAGQFEVAQELEEQIDTATGTEGDGTPDDLTAPTAADILGEDAHPRRKRTRSLRRRGNRLRLPRNRRIASSTKRSMMSRARSPVVTQAGHQTDPGVLRFQSLRSNHLVGVRTQHWGNEHRLMMSSFSTDGGHEGGLNQSA